MKAELQNLLAEYLGELLHKEENTFDWIEKDAVIRKINAVYELLDIGVQKKTFMDAIIEITKNGLKPHNHE
jgi:hypothetical protein